MSSKIFDIGFANNSRDNNSNIINNDTFSNSINSKDSKSSKNYSKIKRLKLNKNKKLTSFHLLSGNISKKNIHTTSPVKRITSLQCNGTECRQPEKVIQSLINEKDTINYKKDVLISKDTLYINNNQDNYGNYNKDIEYLDQGLNSLNNVHVSFLPSTIFTANKTHITLKEGLDKNEIIVVPISTIKKFKDEQYLNFSKDGKNNILFNTGEYYKLLIELQDICANIEQLKVNNKTYNTSENKKLLQQALDTFFKKFETLSNLMNSNNVIIPEVFFKDDIASVIENNKFLIRKIKNNLSIMHCIRSSIAFGHLSLILVKEFDNMIDHTENNILVSNFFYNLLTPPVLNMKDFEKNNVYTLSKYLNNKFTVIA